MKKTYKNLFMTKHDVESFNHMVENTEVFAVCAFTKGLKSSVVFMNSADKNGYYYKVNMSVEKVKVKHG